LDDLTQSQYFYTGKSTLRDLLSKDYYAYHKKEYVRVGDKIYKVFRRPLNGTENGVFVREGFIVNMGCIGTNYMTEIGASRLNRDIESLAKVYVFIICLFC
jgi:hypothetical protein